MPRNSRTMLAIAALLAAGCEAREVDHVDAVPDSGGPGADAANQDVSVGHDSSGGEEAANEASTQCTLESQCATGATFCCPWRGDVYLWTAKGCREKLHSLTDGIYECLDTGIAAIEHPGACKGYSMATCYERDRGDEEKELIISSVQWPSEYLAGSPWHLCSAEVKEAIVEVPDCCPEPAPSEGAPCDTVGLSCGLGGMLSCPETAVCAADGLWKIQCPALAIGTDAACGCPHPGGE